MPATQAIVSLAPSLSLSRSTNAGLAFGFPRPQLSWIRANAVLLVAVATFAGLALIMVTRQTWSTSQGAHGPIVLFSGLWMLWREWLRAPAGRGDMRLAVGALLPLLAVYVLAMTVGAVWPLWISMALSLMSVLYAIAGMAAMRALWFPLLYLLWAVPPPSWVTAPLTDFLTDWLSTVSVDLLWMTGFDVARSGVDLYIDQYELRMADACAGLNSLFSLFAIGMFYIYLRHRADWRYAAILALVVPPVAVLANLARVLILMLMTHSMGDAVAQGFLHGTTGMLMFIVALIALMGIDAALSPLRRRLARA